MPGHLPDDPFDYLTLVRKGLPRTSRPKDVIIIGAGMAGLTAGFELLRAGHRPVLLEATKRPGGRLYTLRAPFSDNLYSEAGAMRIPEVHAVTMHYLRDLFGLRTRPFPNVNIDDQGFYFLRGELHPGWRVKDDPGFAANRVQRIWNASFRDIRTLLVKAEGEGRRDEVWRAIVERYRNHSLRDFLVEQKAPAWSGPELEMFGILGLGLGGYDALLGISFVELMRIFFCGWDEHQQEVVGGIDQLPRRFLDTPPPGTDRRLEDVIHYGAEAVRMEQSEGGVTVFYRSAGEIRQRRGDCVIVTVPLPVLATTVEIDPPLANGKRRAIQNLHYLASAKVFLQSRERFWEELDGDGHVAAGTTITDLPLRAAYFPRHPHPGTRRGVIIASYTWEEDAQKWYPPSDAQRVAVAARDLGRIFPWLRECLEVGASVAWHLEPFARGAFALLTPGQIDLVEELMKPEGRIFFAGEHASHAHGWVEGAAQSGLRAALGISESSAARV
jgi:monoamine oxidase